MQLRVTHPWLAGLGAGGARGLASVDGLHQVAGGLEHAQLLCGGVWSRFESDACAMGERFVLSRRTKERVEEKERPRVMC